MSRAKCRLDTRHEKIPRDSQAQVSARVDRKTKVRSFAGTILHASENAPHSLSLFLSNQCSTRYSFLLRYFTQQLFYSAALHANRILYKYTSPHHRVSFSAEEFRMDCRVCPTWIYSIIYYSDIIKLTILKL